MWGINEMQDVRGYWGGGGLRGGVGVVLREMFILQWS